MRNPFNNQSTIHDLSRFIGRGRSLRRIFDALMTCQNISLVGPQRIGKTSILNCLCDEETQKRLGYWREDFLYVYCDLQDYSLEDHHDIFAHLNEAIRRQKGQYVAGVKFEQRSHMEFKKLLEAFKEQGFHPIVMIDTFDEITRYDEFGSDLFKFLRGQATRLVSYVTASIQRLSTLCPEDVWGSPFHNIFMTHIIGPFTPEEAHEMLTVLPKRSGLPLSEEEIAWVLKMAGTHPYILTHTAAVLFDTKRDGDEQLDLDQVRKEVYQNVESYFEDRWQQMNMEERARLESEVKQGGNPKGSYPELNASALFHEYLRLRVVFASDKMPVSEMSREDFTKILADLNNPRALGECALITLPLIAERIRKEKVENVADKGKIVRKALYEALDRLQGPPGVSREESPEWQSFNILYYRHRKGMRQKDVMARLGGIPDSTYYRMYRKAVNDLQLSLLDLEMKDQQSPG